MMLKMHSFHLALIVFSLFINDLCAQTDVQLDSMIQKYTDSLDYYYRNMKSVSGTDKTQIQSQFFFWSKKHKRVLDKVRLYQYLFAHPEHDRSSPFTDYKNRKTHRDYFNRAVGCDSLRAYARLLMDSVKPQKTYLYNLMAIYWQRDCLFYGSEIDQNYEVYRATQRKRHLDSLFALHDSLSAQAEVDEVQKHKIELKLLEILKEGESRMPLRKQRRIADLLARSNHADILSYVIRRIGYLHYAAETTSNDDEYPVFYYALKNRKQDLPFLYQLLTERAIEIYPEQSFDLLLLQEWSSHLIKCLDEKIAKAKRIEREKLEKVKLWLKK